MNFHPEDLNLILNALRFVLDGFTRLRTGKGQKEPDKREEVLKETVERAEEMSAGGAGVDTVVSEIETKLEQGLGTEAKDEIIGRAASILALAEPFEVESFEYYKNLVLVLTKAKEFCTATNIFKLRGWSNGQFEVLLLPKLTSTLHAICGEFRSVTQQLIVGNTFKVHIIESDAYLTTANGVLKVLFDLRLERAYSVGGSYKESADVESTLAAGDEVNMIGLETRTSKHDLIRDVQFRLTGKQFKEIVSALFEDLNHYANELAEEQRDFGEQIAPALKAIINRWPQFAR
jgi:hypothetical protein